MLGGCGAAGCPRPSRPILVTKCVEARRPVLAVPSAAEIVIESLAHARRQGQI
jgi:hypothetical protein